MSVSAKLKAFLNEHGIKHRVQKHPAAYTAQEIAAAQHVSGKRLAKCVAIITDQGLRLAVLPAVQLVDFPKLKKLLKVKRVTLAREADIKKAFPDIEVGAMSAFGNLYGIPTAIDDSLADGEFVCNAGTHTETIALRYDDFTRAAKPMIGRFSMAIKTKTQPPKRKTAKGKRGTRNNKKKTPAKRKALTAKRPTRPATKRRSASR